MGGNSPISILSANVLQMEKTQMTVDVYPAYLNVREFEHADDWSDETTLNMANGNFYTFFTQLMGEQNVPAAPGYWSVDFVEKSLKNATFAHERYSPAMWKIVDKAKELRASHICYA